MYLSFLAREAGRKTSGSAYEVCKKHNPSTYFISQEDELSEIAFNPNEKIGICGATSTPMWLMEKVKKALEAY